MNESWGVRDVKTDPAQQAHCNAMMLTTKALDPTRLVLDNDGWEHTCGDLLTIHDYTSSPELLQKHMESLESILAITPDGKPMYADGYSYAGQPIMVGVSFSGWRSCFSDY